ncbi:helix-turn-helix domain-containing protein [Roseicyclus elongatus]|uniref:helix-turn-helix domain-containing protein n=1 Tax=Roseicyclus elongatus TaxID=159346 RepID=UPI00316AE295
MPSKERTEMERKIYTTEELAARFRCTPRCIIDWIRKGCPTGDGRVKLPARKLGRRWFATEEDVVLFEHRSRPSNDGRPALELDDE